MAKHLLTHKKAPIYKKGFQREDTQSASKRNNCNFGKKTFRLGFTRTGEHQTWPGLVIVIVDRLGLLGSEGLKKVVTITLLVFCFLPTKVEVSFHNISVSSIQSSHHFHFHIEVMMVKILKKE